MGFDIRDLFVSNVPMLTRAHKMNNNLLGWIISGLNFYRSGGDLLISVFSMVSFYEICVS